MHERRDLRIRDRIRRLQSVEPKQRRIGFYSIIRWIPDEGTHLRRIECQAQALLAASQRRLHAASIKHGTDTRNKLARRERLRDIVICSRQQAFDGRLLASPRSHENHWDMLQLRT